MARKLKIPYGFQDYMQDECYNKRCLERELSQVYSGYGYREVETPTIEYYDTFHDVYAPDKLKKMFKLTDNDGSLLALRPDITLQICRMASKLDLSFPQRLFYAENCFEYLDSIDTARTREFSQMGVELIGESGIEGDIEIVTLAIKSFLASGLENFKIEIGNNNFFKGIISESGLEASDILTLTELINKKDSLAVEMFLQKKNVSERFCSALLLLPTLFGEKEVFRRAREVCENALTLSAFEDTKLLYETMERAGYGKYISIDFGMLHGLNYYSGLVLKGYSKNLGLCLLDGGRYDELCPSFGFPGSAVGFAIGIKRLLTALDEKGKLRKMLPCNYAYFSDNADEKTERDYVDSLRESGKSVVKLFFKNKDALIDYCKRNNIKKAFCISGTTVINLDKEVV